MKILVTGAKGFIGKNLIAQLKTFSDHTILEYDIGTPEEELHEYLKSCDFIYHLAGVNRSNKEEDFIISNKNLIHTILNKLIEFNNCCPVLVTSSIQAELDNCYGISKKIMEEETILYSEKTNAKVYIYRLPNVFGKWCLPNYNSVISTFCYNLNNGIPLRIDNPDAMLKLVYIDQVVSEFINALYDKIEKDENGFCKINTTYDVKLNDIVVKLNLFKENKIKLKIPNLANEFDKYLYSTYLSYLPENDFSYMLKTNIDDRGVFCEFLKSDEFGQISVSTTKPGVTRGNHWHNTKIEKFLVVKGEAVVKFRNIYDESIIEYVVSDKKMQTVDVPVGYTHCFKNIGTQDLIMIIWSNEIFNSNIPDTIFLEV